MATSSGPGNSKGPLVDSGLCRCCKSIKKCRLLTAEYEWTGQKEIYSEMLRDCFGLRLSNLDGDNKECCICATCVGRLREACSFRHQVLQSELALMEAKEGLFKEDKKTWQIEVKIEPPSHSDVLDSPDRSTIYTDCKPAKQVKVKLKAEKNKKVHVQKPSIKAKKEDLINNMNRLRAKLDFMRNQRPPKRAPQKTTVKKKKSEIEHDEMVYKNTVTIVNNSYICPFVTRTSMYYCYYCKEEYANPADLREHNLTHDPKNKFEHIVAFSRMPKMDITRVDCRLCAEKIDTIEDFKNHITTVHGKTICPVDNEFIKFKLTLNNLKCIECDATFLFIDLLVKHMIEHFGKFVCDLCGASFFVLSTLKYHIKNHDKDEVHFLCEICGKNLKSKHSRALHIATVHEKKATIDCYKCDATFMSYALRTKHLIEVHEDKRSFPCKFCDKVYNRRKTLGEHYRRIHLKVFKHKCDVCDQKFYVPCKLKEHMATHTGERNFKCEFCDKSYPRLQALQEHMRSHSSEDRFKCDMCGAAFTDNDNLKIHMKSHHQFMDNSFN